MRSLVLFTFALICLAPARSAAQSYFAVDIQAIEPDGIVVQCRTVLFQTPCTSVPDECDRTEIVTVTVTPCPPGVSCDGGSYQFSWDTSRVAAPPLLLAPDTSYDFAASYEINVMAMDNSGKCRVAACQGTGEIAGTNLVTPAIVTPQWNATAVGLQDDLLAVEFSATVNEVGLCSTTEECFDAWYSLSITPCPPNVNCPTGSYEFQAIDTTNDQQPLPPFQLLLEPNVSYELAGSRFVEVWGIHHVVACQDVSCSYREFFATTEFVTGAIPNDPVSWGTVKARY